MYKQFQKAPIVEFPNKVKSNPLVSVCVQTYQHANFIKQCLDGILMQKTDFEIEVLLGEDDSIDGTRDICIDYAQKYPEKIRLILHSRENNIKIGGAPSGRFNFIYNLTNAKGKYIALCEGDDYWTDPLKLQYQVDFLEDNKAFSLCAHAVETIFDKTWKHGKINRFLEPKIIARFENILDYHYLPTNSLLLRTNSILNFPNWTFTDKNLIAADVLLSLMVACHGKVYFMEKTMAIKRVNGGGITANIKERRKRMLSYKLVLYAIINRYSQGKYRKILLPKLIRQYFRVINQSLKSGRIMELSISFKYICPPYL